MRWVKAERVLKLFPLACIQSSKVWIKAFIMAAVTFRWKQQLLGVAAQPGHHLLPLTVSPSLRGH